MDAQRLAAHAEREDYLQARDAMLDLDGRQAAARQARHQREAQQALGLPDGFWEAGEPPG